METIKQQLLNNVIECLKGSKQTLVSFGSIECPVNEIFRDMGDSLTEHAEIKKAVFDQLIEDDIVEYHTGFTSNAEIPAFYVPDGCCLTDSFFETYCTPRSRKFTPHQLSLFNGSLL